jgi:hypothetical protein
MSLGGVRPAGPGAGEPQCALSPGRQRFQPCPVLAMIMDPGWRPGRGPSVRWDPCR